MVSIASQLLQLSSRMKNKNEVSDKTKKTRIPYYFRIRVSSITFYCGNGWVLYILIKASDWFELNSQLLKTQTVTAFNSLTLIVKILLLQTFVPFFFASFISIENAGSCI